MSRFGNWFFGRKPVQEERRISKRFGLHDMVTLTWPTSAGDSAELQAQLIDLSEGGIAVRVDQEIRVGQPVRISGLRGDADAVVRHVRPDDSAFVVGLETLSADRGV